MIINKVVEHRISFNIWSNDYYSKCLDIEKFSIFISKFVNNIENIQINNNIKKVYTDHIMFDINFLLLRSSNFSNVVNKLILSNAENRLQSSI